MIPKSENFGWEESKIIVQVRWGQIKLFEALSELVDPVVGEEFPQLGSDYQQFLLTPGCSWRSWNILTTMRRSRWVEEENYQENLSHDQWEYWHTTELILLFHTFHICHNCHYMEFTHEKKLITIKGFFVSEMNDKHCICNKFYLWFMDRNLIRINSRITNRRRSCVEDDTFYPGSVFRDSGEEGACSNIVDTATLWIITRSIRSISSNTNQDVLSTFCFIG